MALVRRSQSALDRLGGCHSPRAPALLRNRTGPSQPRSAGARAKAAGEAGGFVWGGGGGGSVGRHKKQAIQAVVLLATKSTKATQATQFTQATGGAVAPPGCAEEKPRSRCLAGRACSKGTSPSPQSLSTRVLGWNQYSTGIWSIRRTTKWLSEADSAVRITPARPQRQRELVPVALP
jgi:hypothetical protein